MYFKCETASYSYDISGEGEAVLLLHGFTGSKETWSSLKEFLLPKFKVITIDLPGHGQTLSKQVTMEECCHHLAKFLKYIKVEEAHIIGYSMGGRLALSFAMMFPERVRSLILESSSPGLETDKERQDRILQDKKLAGKLNSEGIESFVRFWEDIPLFQSQKSLSLDVRESIRVERLGQEAEGLADSLTYMGTGAQPSWWGKLSSLFLPTLLLVGELDEKFVLINERMAKLIPNCKMEVIKEAGHALHIERPVDFNSIVKQYLITIKEDL